MAYIRAQSTSVNQSFGFYRVVASVDTWKWLVKSPLKPHFIKNLREQYGSQFMLDPLNTLKRYLPWVLTVHQPQPQTIKIISNLEHVMTYQVHVAYDFITSDTYATTAWLQSHVVQTYRQSHHRSKQVGNSLYAKDDKRAKRNMDVYEKDEIDATRVEIRWLGSAARNIQKEV